MIIQWALGLGIVLAVSACGGRSGNATDPVVAPRVEKFSFDINHTWSVSSKTCGNSAVAVKPHETYKLDADHFVRIEGVEDSASLCKVGYVYTRTNCSFETLGEVYRESSVLRAAGAKKTCWKKDGDKIVTPPFSEEVLDFASEESRFQLVAVGNSLSVDMHDKELCPEGTMNLKLRKKK